jgi:hypothetical protein
MKYEIRPHHCFKGWYLVFRDGNGMRAFANKSEAQSFVDRQRIIDDMKKREVRL